MTWTIQIHPDYPEIEIEAYKSNDPDTKQFDRTYYFDKNTRTHLGCIWESRDEGGKQADLQNILNRHKEIVKMNGRFASFDGVAKMYEEIKPLRGARKADNIRPLWARRYWWRRVVKMSDNKYVLHDGEYTWQRSFEESCELAPITWERRDDGDYITVRNCANNHYSVSRYAFLSQALPRAMWFRMDNGKHYIEAGGESHYLPKFPAHYDRSLAKVVIDQDVAITFKANTDGTYTRVTEKLPMKVRRIDKDLKAKYDPLIKDLWAWGCAVLPILGETMHDYHTRGAYVEKINPNSSIWNWTRDTDPKLVREILEDPEDERRMALCAIVAWNANAFGGNDFKGFTDNKENFRNFKKELRKAVDVSAVELR